MAVEAVEEAEFMANERCKLKTCEKGGRQDGCEMDAYAYALQAAGIMGGIAGNGFLRRRER